MTLSFAIGARADTTQCRNSIRLVKSASIALGRSQQRLLDSPVGSKDSSKLPDLIDAHEINVRKTLQAAAQACNLR